MKQLVGNLCGFVEHEGATMAVARSVPGEPLDVRIPPPGFAVTTEDVATNIVGALAHGLSDKIDAVGVVFPAARGEERIEACAEAQSAGRAVCVAGRTPSGVGTVGLFRATDGTGWEEAHADLDWLCERLRLLISKEPLDSTETAVFTVNG
jgi:hypothetical protein